MKKSLQILIFIITIKKSLHHKCIHSKIAKKMGSPIIEEERTKKKITTEKSRNLSESWHPIKIKTDFSNITNVSTETQNYIKEIIIPELIKRFQLLIKVKGDSIIQGFSSKTCKNEIKIPSSYSKETKNADLILFIKIENSSENFLAWAFPCTLERKTLRPIIGLIAINEKYLKPEKSQIEKFVKVLLHEALHILAISPSLYDKIPTSSPSFEKATITSNIGKKEIYRLTTPKLIQAAKTHFKCDTITGINLENEGTEASAGAHFEKIHYGNELMNPQEVGMPSLSILTLSFLEDTTWYQIDFNFADTLYWGKNKGCAFVDNSQCQIRFEEFCSVEREISCSGDYKVKTLCDDISFADDCFVAEPVHSYVCANGYDFVRTSRYEETGKFSRCLRTVQDGKIVAGCYFMKCENGFPVVEIEGVKRICDAKNQEIKFFDDFSVLCPDPKDFCTQLNDSCSEDCNGNGRCSVGNICLCDYFYQGSNCGESRNCGSSEICQTIKNKEYSQPSSTDNESLNFNDIFDVFGFNPFKIAFSNLFMVIFTIFIN